METTFLAVVSALAVGVLAFLSIPMAFGWTPFMLLSALIVGLVSILFSYHYLSVLIESFMDHQNDSQNPIRRGKDDFSAVAGVVGMDVKEFKKAITDAREKLNSIFNSIREELNPSEIRTHVKSIVETGHLVLDEIVADPADYNAARSWLNVYLDQTNDIVNKYVELREKSHSHFNTFVTVRKETEETLAHLDTSFKNLLERLHANDIKALQVDMEVLREQLKTERN